MPAICAAYALGSCSAKAGTCFITAPTTPAMARMLICSTANLTLVRVRHTAQPRRASGFSCESARREPTVIDAKKEPLRRDRRQRAYLLLRRGECLIEVGEQIVGVLQANGDADQALGNAGGRKCRRVQLTMRGGRGMNRDRSG